MSIVIDLPNPVEARIEREAQQAGISPTELVADVLEKNFSNPIDMIDAEAQKRLNAPSISLLQSWLEEGRKPRTPEELAEAEADMLQLWNLARRDRSGNNEDARKFRARRVGQFK